MTEFLSSQTKFSSRSRAWVELPSESDYRSRVKLRLDHRLKNKEDNRRLSEASQLCSSSSGASSSRSSQDRGRLAEPQVANVAINFHDKDAVLSLFEDNLEIKVSDVPLTMAMSYVTGLTDLIEDEIIPKPIPLKVRVHSHRYFLFHNFFLG